MGQILDNVLQAIGHTPLIRLSRLSSAHHCLTPVLAKIEGLNPSGSVKDRAALFMLTRAIEQGTLRPDGCVIEATAGNGGLSLAMVCAVLGLRCVIVLPDSAPLSHREHLRLYGAGVELVSADAGSAGCAQRAAEVAKTIPGGMLSNQFGNEHNPEAHRMTTARELLDAAGSIDYLVAGVGTGGTITGCAEAIKMECPDCRIVAVEPFSSPVLSGGFPGSHPLAGIGPGFIPEILNLYILDEVIRVKTPDSLALVRQLAATEGLLCGPSSGAALSAAILVAQRPEAAGKTVVTILPDCGERYLTV